MIRNLIFAWMLALVGSLLLPLASVATVSGTTYDTSSTTMTAPATIVEHTEAVETVNGAETSLQNMASYHARALLGFCRSFVAPNKPMWGSWKDYRKVSQGGREYAQVGGTLYFCGHPRFLAT